MTNLHSTNRGPCDAPYCLGDRGHTGGHDYELPPERDGSEAEQCTNCGYFFPDNSTHFNRCNTEEDAARFVTSLQAQPTGENNDDHTA